MVCHAFVNDAVVEIVVVAAVMDRVNCNEKVFQSCRHVRPLNMNLHSVRNRLQCIKLLMQYGGAWSLYITDRSVLM